MKKIRILHFELDHNLGGIEMFLLNLYKEIDRNLIQFDFITQSDTPALENDLKDLGANIFKVSNSNNVLKYRNDILKIISLKEYDLIHIHKNSLANIIPLLCAKKRNLPVILHSHNTRPSTGKISYLLHIINKNKAYKLANEHFACSNEAGKWMYGNLHYDIIRNGILTDNFRFNSQKRKKIRLSMELPEDAFIVGNVGRFTKQKNHEKLIDIFNDILKTNENSYLLLIGTGENKDFIKKKAIKLGIINNVKFLGNRNDIPDLLMAMDAFVMPSLYEGLPISAVEAQATGLKTYLSDKISPETELSSVVNWFSIEWDACSIAKLILEGTKISNNRTLSNDEIIKAGFSMELSAKFIQETYIKYVTSESNDFRKGFGL